MAGSRWSPGVGEVTQSQGLLDLKWPWSQGYRIESFDLTATRDNLLFSCVWCLHNSSGKLTHEEVSPLCLGKTQAFMLG